MNTKQIKGIEMVGHEQHTKHTYDGIQNKLKTEKY